MPATLVTRVSWLPLSPASHAACTLLLSLALGSFDASSFFVHSFATSFLLVIIMMLKSPVNQSSSPLPTELIGCADRVSIWRVSINWSMRIEKWLLSYDKWTYEIYEWNRKRELMLFHIMLDTSTLVSSNLDFLNYMF